MAILGLIIYPLLILKVRSQLFPGDKDEKAIINLGCEPGTIYKVGRPVFDKIYILKNSNQKKKINQLKNDKPIVAFSK